MAVNTSNISLLEPNLINYQEYSVSDESLISHGESSVVFDPSTDHIEYFVSIPGNNQIIYEEVNSWDNYSLIDNKVNLNYQEDLELLGFSQGKFNVVYNFLQNLLSSSPERTFYISQISSDRTEIRLSSNSISSFDINNQTIQLLNELNATDVTEFYVNFGGNRLLIANNILLDITGPTVLIKLYEPLPNQFNVKSECWLVQKVANSIGYEITLVNDFEDPDFTDNIQLRGPNLNVNLKDQINNSTNYESYTSLSNTNNQQGTGSLYYQLNSILAEKGLEINVDYSDWSDFVSLSSAETRLENFYYKLSLIEQYQYSSSLSTSGSSGNSYYVSSSNAIYQAKIDDIITNFDGYEYYLYFESSSTTWPKTNSEPPYINASTGSALGISFYTSQSAIALDYDNNNNNALINAIPAYLREDPNNYQYELFVEMLGQMFDNVWIYLKDVTNKFNADNRLNYGVSKDLVADVLRDLGVKIYQNNFSSNDLYSALLGYTPSGSALNIPYATSSLNPPLGWEYINTFITASATGSLIPTDDINKETYKRLYHNLPYLLKTKGTVESIRTLITSFGIPDTVLRINEFGGKDKNFNTWDNWQNEFNYTFYTSGSYFVSSSFNLNTDWSADSDNPQAVEFRFKTDVLPQDTSSIISQSLFETNENVKLILRYTGSGYTTASYDGGPVDPYYQYAQIDFIPDPTDLNSSASVYLPIFNQNWWSVLVNKNGTDYDLYVKSKNYNDKNINTLGYQASASVSSTETAWNASTKAYFGISSSLTNNIFTGSIQEIRYYTVPLSESHFDAYVMNPYSIEGSDYLAFRAPLGGELYTGSVSVHPKVTGSWALTASFTTVDFFSSSFSDFYISSSVFNTNTEYIYFDQVPAGIQNSISNKIKNQNLILPYSSSISNIPNADTLSPFISVQQSSPLSSSYTSNIDYVEVAFSPQNEINEDINSTLGYFNIGDYIGDPRQVSSSSETYPDLDALRDTYFKKYTHNYNIWDYIRLIKYFDNSLFKMILDWSPAHSSVATGVVLKQHLLERNKYPVPQLDTQTTTSYSGSNSGWNEPGVYQDLTLTGSIEIEETIGSNGGAFIDYIPTVATSASFLITPGQVGRIFLSQSGLNNISFVMSSSTGGTTALKVYDSASLPIFPTTRNNTAIITSSLLSSNYEAFNFDYDFKSGYVLFSNNNDSGSNSITITSVTASSINGFSETIQTPSGSVEKYYTNEYEFNGELKGSEYVVTDGNLSNNNVNLVQVYSTSSVPVAYTYPASFFAPGVNKGFARVTASAANLIDYNFEEDKTYYFSFTAHVTGSFGSAKLAVVNSNKTFANGVTEKDTSPYYEDIGLITLTTNPQVIDKFEVKGMNPKVYILDITGGGTVSPTNLSNFTVFEALPEDINNDPILNFVDISRPNDRLFDADYSQNSLIPVNQEGLINGNATRASIPASNYTMVRSANPRYFGSRSTSPGFNQIPVTGSGIGQLPNVEQTIPYFIYTPGGRGGTLAELSGSGNYVIGFVVDEDGKIYKPNTTEENIYSTVIYNNFTTNDQVVLSNINNSDFLNATQSYSIYKPLVNSQNILHSDTGSVGQNYLVNGYYDNISMSLAPGVNTSIKAKAIGPYEYNLPSNTETTASFNTPTINQANALTASTGLYIYPQGYISLRGSITASMSYDVNDPGVGPPDYTIVTLKIYKNGTEIASASKTSDTGSINNQHGISSSIYLSPGDTFYVTLNSFSNDLDRYDFNNYEVNPFTGSNSNYSIDIGSYYFTTGSNSQYILTASADMSYFYGGLFQQEELTSNNTSSGFGNPQPFVINPLDEIRFEGDESKVYVINSVEYDGINSILYLYLNSPITSDSLINLNYFSIRRWAFSSDNLIIKSGTTLVGPGLILPLYPTQKLKDNLDNIVAQLQKDSLI